jgi:Fic family protein
MNIENHKVINQSSLNNYVDKKIIVDFYKQEFHKLMLVKLILVDTNRRHIVVISNNEKLTISFNNISAVYEEFLVKPFVPQNLPVKVNWEKFTRLISEVNMELGKYNGLLHSIPNTEVIFSPLTTQEAVLSSRIEGTQATLKDVLEFEAKKNKNIENVDDIVEIRNYRKTLDEAHLRIKNNFPLSLRLLKDMHSTLMQGVRGENRDPGNFRTIQNWIGKSKSTLVTADFIPPSPETIIEHLGNLEKYMHYAEKDRLVQLAIIHAQFEIIHPFLDGNGRIGRLLIPLFLFEKKILTKPLFYISAYFESDRDSYYAMLRSVSNTGIWDEWIEYFLIAVREQAIKNINLAKEIIDLHNSLKQKIRDITNSKYSLEILDLLFEKPIFSTKNFRDALGAKPPVIKRNLDKLLKNNLIEMTEKGAGTRPSLYRFSALFRISDFTSK